MRNSNSRLSALIFDVDGTLAETEEVHRAAFNDAFAAAGLPWHWDQALYATLLCVTGGKERIAHAQTLAPLRTALTASDIATLHEAKTQFYAARVKARGLTLRPGVRRLLGQAHAAGLKLAIATTTSMPNVSALLEACAPLPPFDVIAAGDMAPHKKPAPDIYKVALQLLALEPAFCFAFEDSWNGLRSAAGARLRCLITVSAYGGAGPFPGAAAVLSDLGEPHQPAATRAGPPPPAGVADLDYLFALAESGA